MLLDTLAHFVWFEMSDDGKGVELGNPIPPQYLPSWKEWNALFKPYGMIVISARPETLAGFKIAHYLLKSSDEAEGDAKER